METTSRIVDEPLVARATPLTGIIAQGSNERAVDEQVGKREGLANLRLGPASEGFQPVARVDDGMDVARLKVTEERQQSYMLEEGFSTEYRHSISRLAHWIEESRNDVRYAQADSSGWIMRFGHSAPVTANGAALKLNNAPASWALDHRAVIDARYTERDTRWVSWYPHGRASEWLGTVQFSSIWQEIADSCRHLFHGEPLDHQIARGRIDDPCKFTHRSRLG